MNLDPARAVLGLRLLGLRRGPVALASRSPRRRELLARLEVPHFCLDLDEKEGDRGPEEPPSDYVIRLATRKLEAARAGATAGGAYVVLAADTVVVVDGDVLEKPIDRDDAARLLDRISGRWHEVFTGIALCRLEDGRFLAHAERSRVHLDLGDAATRDAYIATDEPMDKAGAYGIQGWGGLFVPHIEGDYFNVMGLPLAALRGLCRQLEGGRE
jgi:septum formation protein